MAPAEASDDGITSINITPLVDVFLVLLILVMITSSLIDHREIPVSVPKSAQGSDKAPKASGLAMDVDRRIFLDGRPADSAAIRDALRRELALDPDHQVLIAADQRLIYEDVVRLLDWVKGAGVRKYALKASRAE